MRPTPGSGTSTRPSTAVGGWWTGSAAAPPWIAAFDFLVIAPVVAGLARVDRASGVPLAATFGGGVGLLAVAALLLAEPLAGMAGPVLPVVAMVVGALVGGCAVGIGRRLRPRTAGVIMIATVVMVPLDHRLRLRAGAVLGLRVHLRASSDHDSERNVDLGRPVRG